MKAWFLLAFCGLHLQFAWAAPPANDNFANAQSVTTNVINLTGSNVEATAEAGEPSVTQSQKTIWYKWVTGTTGYNTVATSGSSFDTILSVYTGTALSNLSLVASNDNLAFPDHETTGVATNTSRVNFVGVGGATYYIRIAGASNASGTTKLNINRFDSTVGATVVNSSQVRLSWLEVSGATGYRLYRSTTSSDFSNAVVLTPTTNSYLDTNLSFNTTYYYAVKALVAGGKTYGSKEVKVKLNDKFANAQLIVGNTSNFPDSNVDATAETGEPSFDSSQKTLWYKWVATRTGDNTVATSGSSFDTILSVYTGTALSNLDLVGENDDLAFPDHETAGVATNTSRVNFVATVGTTYYIRIAGVSGQSGTIKIHINRFDTHTMNASVNSSGHVALSWAEVSGATGYRIYRSTTPSDFSNAVVLTPTTNSYVNTGLPFGTTYYYILKALVTGGKTYGSRETSVAWLGAPTNLSATSGSGSVLLNWSSVAGANYSVWRSSDNTTFSELATDLTAPSYNDANLVNGSTYYYQVRAFNSTGVGAFSASVSAIPLAAPSNLTATPGPGRVTLSWDAVVGASRYDIYRTTDANPTLSSFNGAALAGQTENSYVDSSVTLGTKYSYIVKASRVTGQSAASSIISATAVAVPDVPSGLKATPGDGSALLSWNAVSGATSYDLWQSGDGGTTFSVVGDNLTVTSYTDTALINGNTYFYQVRACNSGGDGAFSASVSTVPVGAPTNLLVATASSRQVSLSWSAPSGGADSYSIYRSTSSGNYSATPVGTTTTRTFTDTGLTNGTTYYYIVKGDHGGGLGNSSNQVSVTPIPDLDASIRPAPAEGETGDAWTGDNIINSTGQNQSMTRQGDAGAATSFEVEVFKSGGSDDVVVTAPAFEDDWSASFFFNNQDISAAVTGAGWMHAMQGDDSFRIRVEITPPLSAAAGLQKELAIRARATTPNGGLYDEDVVKAIVTARAVAQPDLSVRALTEDETDADIVWMGEGLLSSNGSNQVLSSFTLTGEARSFVLRVKNSGNIAATFGLSLPAPPAGWTVRLFDSLEGGTDITSAVQGAQGWTLPSLAAGATKELRLEVASSAAALASYEAKPRVAGSSLVDVVSIQNTLQRVAGIEMSLDHGQTWIDVPAPESANGFTVPQDSVVGLRVKRGNENMPWPDEPFKPEWRRSAESHFGAEVWLHFPDATPAGEAGEEVQVECGNSLSLRVRVLPEE